jgi:hypothetical protein
MVCMPNSSILWDCIQQIVTNVHNKTYGYNPLYPTGPGLLADKYFGEDGCSNQKINEFNYFNSFMGDRILSRNGVILEHYPEYRMEQKQSAPIPHYHQLWTQRNVYM